MNRTGCDNSSGTIHRILAHFRTDLRIINLETSITTSNEYWPKGTNYRMHPQKSSVLTTASIDCCILANNHLLDWGCKGLVETVQTLERVDIWQAGTGLTNSNTKSTCGCGSSFSLSGFSEIAAGKCTSEEK